MTHTATAGGATRSYAVSVTGGGGSGTCDALDIGRGLATVKCQTTTTGAAPPTAPTTITVWAYPDNVQFGTPGGAGSIWSVVTACAGGTFTESCTADGTAGGSAQYGFLRLVVEAKLVVAGNTIYDINNDNGGTPGTGNTVGSLAHEGISCDPNVNSITDGNPTSSPATYIGGDTLREGITVDASYYASEPATPVVPAAICSASTTTAAGITPGTSAVTTDFSIKGGPTIQSAPWPTGCTLTEQFQNTALLTTTGFTSAHPFKWFSVPAGASLTDDFTAQRSTTKLLNRNLAPSATCAYTVGGQNVIGSFVMRGETVAGGNCHWIDARGNHPPNNQLAMGYTTRASQPLNDQGDFTSVNALFNSQGDLTSTVFTAGTTATVTSQQDYSRNVEEYGASRTSGELLNSGRDCSTTPCRFDISATYTWTNDFTGKTQTQQTRAFTIGADTVNLQCQGLKDARGNLVSGASVTMTQKTPSGGTRANRAESTTDASGNSIFDTFDVVAPAGVWTFICDGALNGNDGMLSQGVTYISSLTSFYTGAIGFNHTDGRPTSQLNVSVALRVWDGMCDCILPLQSDDVVRLTFQSWNPVTKSWTTSVANRVKMNPNPGSDFTYYLVVNLGNQERAHPDYAFATFNVSGKPILSSQYWTYDTLPRQTTLQLTNSTFDVLLPIVLAALMLLLVSRGPFILSPLGLIFGLTLFLLAFSQTTPALVVLLFTTGGALSALTLWQMIARWDEVATLKPKKKRLFE